MATYEHLPLRRLEGVLQRRQHGFGSVPNRDAKAHGSAIQKTVEDVIDAFKGRPAIADINPSLILKIKTDGVIDEEVWQRLGMTLLSSDGDSSLVLFVNDTELQEFKYRLAEYQKDKPEGQKGPRYAGLISVIEWVAELDPSDRIGPVLKLEGKSAPADFADGDIELLDVELWRPNEETVWGFIAKVAQRLAENGGKLISEYKGTSMTLVRVECGGAAIKALLDLPEVLMIDRPPQPDLPFLDISSFNVANIPPPTQPTAGALSIGIIDSGVAAAHPLMATAVVGTFGVPPAIGDDDQRGHGTPVSGIAIYGDVRQQLPPNRFQQRFKLASAKLVDLAGKFDPSLTVTQAMDIAIRRLHAEFGCTVINISLADPNRLVGAKPTPWAAILDELARELDLVIVVAAGNRENFAHVGEAIIAAYPKCLLEDANRILEPASAINVVTVGSLAHSNGIAEHDEDYVGVLPVTELDHPSPFTRVGPGVGKIIKPDFVDYGGTFVFDGPTQSLQGGKIRAEAGILSLHSHYITKLLSSVSGTSFASPLVAYKAAILREMFPNASANLVRALMANSAQVPDGTEECLSEFTETERAMVVGNGVINLERALYSEDDRVVLFKEDVLAVNKFAVYEVPIPPEFQEVKGSRRIRVSLAFDPVVRHTRMDYAGLNMSFDLFRGMTSEEVFDACRKYEVEEGDALTVGDARKCKMKPGPQLRGRGTLQCAVFPAARSLAGYGDTYYLAVRCEGGWASEITPEQRFAVVVELEHDAEIELYSRVEARVRLPA